MLQKSFYRLLLATAVATLFAAGVRAQTQNPPSGTPDKSDAAPTNPGKNTVGPEMSKSDQKSLNRDNRSTSKDFKADNRDSNKEHRATANDAKSAAKAESNTGNKRAASKEMQKSTKTERKDLQENAKEVNKDQRALSKSSTKSAEKQAAKANRNQHVSQSGLQDKKKDTN